LGYGVTLCKKVRCIHFACDEPMECVVKVVLNNIQAQQISFCRHVTGIDVWGRIPLRLTFFTLCLPVLSMAQRKY